MPSADEAANELRNRNINQSSDALKSFARTGEGGESTDQANDGSSVQYGVPLTELLS